jgi:hypothetical protein
MWLIFNVSPTFQPRVGGKGQDNRQTVYSTTTDYALDVAAGLPEVIALRTHATTTSDDDRYLHLPGLIVAESAAGDVRYLMPDGAPEDGRGSIRQAAYADGSITVTSLTDDAIDSDSGDVQVMNSAVFGQESGVDTDSGAIEVRNSTVTGLSDGVNGNLVGVTGALLDPGLNPLADNGGPSQTQALQYGSPALDQIPNGVNGCGLTTVTDQRGTGRPQNGARDMGAYESLGFYLSLSGGDN